MTQLCEKVLSEYLVTAGSRYQVRSDGEGGYTCSRVFPQVKPLGTIPADSIIGPIEEVHIVKILEEDGVEAAIPSICKLWDVIYVMTSRETERFVNEIQIHEAKTRSRRKLLENFQESEETMSYKQRIAPDSAETRANFVNLVPNKASIYKSKNVPKDQEEWITIHTNPKRGSDLAIFIPKTVLSMLRHVDQDEREADGSRHWDAIKSVLLRKFERDGFQDFNDEVWLQRIFEGSSKKRITYCKKTSMTFHVI